ncbi:addiction module protein [Mucilaginibacter sp. X4EP1]|uniref:addiction module protein n=1 Tax=Mucilaginibacter sp. X4EP1 TaxID=2723092 RepID=UPI0021682E23|nr:addiction module protein [Mucilaginibacter sp. X4EP1]MCS3812615.1 hypothetical protein [Mucilaginibacter sp. X4EP1]
MNLQFISDDAGKTTRVHIPIDEIDVQDWHKDIVRQRLADYRKKPDQTLDFETAIDDIDNIL